MGSEKKRQQSTIKYLQNGSISSLTSWRRGTSPHWSFRHICNMYKSKGNRPIPTIINKRNTASKIAFPHKKKYKWSVMDWISLSNSQILSYRFASINTTEHGDLRARRVNLYGNQVFCPNKPQCTQGVRNCQVNITSNQNRKQQSVSLKQIPKQGKNLSSHQSMGSKSVSKWPLRSWTLANSLSVEIRMWSQTGGWK